MRVADCEVIKCNLYKACFREWDTEVVGQILRWCNICGYVNNDNRIPRRTWICRMNYGNRLDSF